MTRPSKLSNAAPGPLVVIYHGGGFVTGQPETMAPYARGIARLFDAVVICPTYRLAPEHKFPAAVNDAFDSLQYIARHAKNYNADTEKGFIVGGGSSGGNLSPVLARLAVENNLEPALTGHWVAFPVSQRSTTVPEKYREIWTSWTQNANAMLIDAETGEALFDIYGPDFGSSLWNSLVPGFEVGRLPPAYVQVAGLDLILDDGIVYSYVLDDASVPVRLDAYAGVPHSFFAFIPTLQQSRSAMVDIAKGFGWLLKRDVDVKKAEAAMLLNY
jgi:acetyl esterase/lipase